MTARAFLEVVKAAGAKWNAHNAPRLGASLAYYTLLSMAPLLILMIGICGLVLDQTAAEQQLLDQIQILTGYSVAQTVKMVLESAHHASHGLLATVVALVTLLFGASGVFLELRDSLNTIWDAPRRSASTWRSMLTQRLASFGMVLALGFLLLVSLLLSTALTVAEKFFTDYVPVHFSILGEIANIGISLVAITILFALIFKFVPDMPIEWREVGIGAVATGILFTIGKAVLALYLGSAGVGSTYGAAGSLVAMVVWVYYSAQIFFFGAVFTRAYADRFGLPPAKKERARAKRAAEPAGVRQP